MPFRGDEVRLDRMCGPGADGQGCSWVIVHVEAGALWQLGLHPDQPPSVVNGPSPPGWWHAAGERYATSLGTHHRSSAPISARTSNSSNTCGSCGLLSTEPSQPSTKPAGIDTMPGFCSGNQAKSEFG